MRLISWTLQSGSEHIYIPTVLYLPTGSVLVPLTSHTAEAGISGILNRSF
jgi:hypothetical protein